MRIIALAPAILLLAVGGCGSESRPVAKSEPAAPVVGPVEVPAAPPAVVNAPEPAPSFRIVGSASTEKIPGGAAPVVDAGSNDATRGVAAAIKNGTNPERLSPMAPGKPFDPVADRANPKAYISESEPARPWQTAQPDKDVPVLRKEGMGSPQLRQGESAELAVISAPGFPVSWTITDMGLWDNGLIAITTRADDRGRATARFHAVSGSTNLVNVIVGSPMASGQVVYRITVLPKDQP